MLEFLKDNIIQIMVVLAVAIFAFRFIRLTRSEKQAESKKAAGNESPEIRNAAEPADGADAEGVNDGAGAENAAGAAAAPEARRRGLTQ